MKNKRMLAALLAISLLQLIFPLVLIAYEGGFYSDVLEKGESYTLYYTHINSMNKGVMYTNIGNRYTVGYRWWGEDEDIRDSDTTDYYYKLCIENAEDGKVDFYETDKRELTDYNWFYRYNAFEVNFDDYEGLTFFENVLQSSGVYEKLREAGVQEGDTVSIYDLEFEYVE